MKDWQTNSSVRLEMRKRIRRVIADHVHGPVELLAIEDVKLLRREISSAWRPEDGPRHGYVYMCFLAETRLALCIPGALNSIRAKCPKKTYKAHRMTADQREWLKGQGWERVTELPEQKEVGGLFAK